MVNIKTQWHWTSHRLLGSIKIKLHAVISLIITGIIWFIESCGSTTKATCSLEKKGKASTALESPRKRLRSGRGPAQSAVDTVPIKGVKRKASTSRETPAKKQERGTSIRESHEEHRTKQLPGTETSRQATREDDCEPSPGCSSQSAPIYNSGNMSLPFNRNRGKLSKISGRWLYRTKLYG